MQSLRLSLQHILAHNYKVIFKITDRYTHTEIGLCEHICKVYPKHAMRAKLGISKQRKIYDIYIYMYQYLVVLQSVSEFYCLGWN